jgi:hypothetical protein
MEVSHWAVEGILEEVKWIHREGWSIVKVMFHFIDGEVAKNKAQYNLATSDYWYI